MQTINQRSKLGRDTAAITCSARFVGVVFQQRGEPPPPPPPSCVVCFLCARCTWGRVDSARWGPRAVDVDILLYDDLVLNEGASEGTHAHARVYAGVC